MKELDEERRRAAFIIFILFGLILKKMIYFGKSDRPCLTIIITKQLVIKKISFVVQSKMPHSKIRKYLVIYQTFG